MSVGYAAMVGRCLAEAGLSPEDAFEEIARLPAALQSTAVEAYAERRNELAEGGAPDG